VVRTCVVVGCERPAKERGWCHGHYLRWHRTGDVQAEIPLGRRRQPQICTVDGCGRDTNSRGMCRTHTKRVEKHGDERADVPVKEAEAESRKLV
jgi:hypothetical protein